MRNRTELPPIEQRDWLKAEELPGIIGMSLSTINRHVRGELEPKLAFVPVGKSRRIFRKSTVDAWRADLERRSMAG